MIFNRFFFFSALFFTAIIVCNIIATSVAQASAYVGTQDKQLHYDLQTLAQWGYLDAAVTTYPIPWKGVASGLATMSIDNMPFAPQQAYLRLKHYLSLNKATQNRRFISLQGASDDIRFRSFDDGVESKAKLTVSSEFYAGRFSGQLAASFTSDNTSKRNYDNSFIAYQFGDWNLRVGSLDQWWGPGQSSSLIMSNNARPIKAIALSRSVNTQSQSDWLSWMGPWYFTTQMGQLEANRDIPDAKVFMNRFNARPIKGLEIGLSWVAMWGGKGTGEGLEEFLDVLTFKNICPNGSDNCSADAKINTANHLAGMDISYTATLFERPVTFYAQRIGENKIKNFGVTNNANLLGLSTYFGGAKVYIETSDTNVNCSSNDNTFDCYYEDLKYFEGYRLYDRAIGSTFDSDAKQVTLGTNIRFKNGDMAQMHLRSAKLNADASKPSPVLNVGDSEELVEVSGFYQKPIGNWLLKLGGSISKRTFDSQNSATDAVIYAKAQYAF